MAGENLLKGMHLDAFEDTELSVRIFLCELLRLFSGVHVNHNETPCLIGKWASKDDSTLFVPALYSFKMRRPMNFPFCLTVGPVKPQDNKCHPPPTGEDVLSILAQ